MGLDFSHGEAHWSYTSFNRFRRRLAEAIGIDLSAMDGYTENGLSWDGVTDPIKPLLDHSDNGGELSPEECASVAPRLRELIQGWEEDDPINYPQGMMLAAGMDEAAQAGEPLEFC